MPIEAVIFDIDGTLLDSVDLHAKAWVETFKHFGYDLPYDLVRSQVGKGGDQLLPDLIGQQDADRRGEEIQKFRSELFQERYMGQVKPFPRVRELFQRVIEHGQRPALASSAKGDQLEKFEDIAQIRDLVEEAASSADAEQSKPHPDIFQSALAKLGNVTPDRAIAVGDTPHDAEAAGKAGIRCIGVLCGGFAEEDLRKAGCIAIYQDPEDLWEHYDSSPLVGKAQGQAG
jgi:HAD superfamily hydrolase (TIGR01509 family)